MHVHADGSPLGRSTEAKLEAARLQAFVLGGASTVGWLAASAFMIWHQHQGLTAIPDCDPDDVACKAEVLAILSAGDVFNTLSPQNTFLLLGMWGGQLVFCTLVALAFWHLLANLYALGMASTTGAGASPAQPPGFVGATSRYTKVDSDTSQPIVVHVSHQASGRANT